MELLVNGLLAVAMVTALIATLRNEKRYTRYLLALCASWFVFMAVTSEGRLRLTWGAIALLIVVQMWFQWRESRTPKPSAPVEE